jgi:hypothetical protein
MKAELMKNAPDLTALDDRMNRSVERRKSIIETSTVVTLLEIFPALTLENQVIVNELLILLRVLPRKQCSLSVF